MRPIAEALNPTLKNIKPSMIRRFFDIAAEMDDVISLGIGEPDFTTPWAIREECIRSLEKGLTHYTSNAGITALREELCRYFKRKYDLHYTKDQALITVGGSEAIDLTIRALVSPGDEVIVPEPSFVCYTPLASLAGATPVVIPCKEKDNFCLTAEDLKAAITEKTKLLILPFPNNPTGAVMSREQLMEIAEVLKDTDIFVLSDEIYSELVYTDTPHIPFSGIEGMYERTIIVNGFSKSYAMTGWRLGYALGPQPLIALMTKLHQFAIMSAPTQSQFAAIRALKECDGDVIHMRDSYNQRRLFIYRALLDMGFSCFEPGGAFYIFPNITSSGLSSEEFAERLLREQHVAVIPGNAFGPAGEGHVRICYASSVENLKEAVRRMHLFMESLKK